MVEQNNVLETAYAKINLYLDITGRLDRGFHAVTTVLQTVSLYDEITVSDIREAETTSFELTCDVGSVPTDSTNLAHRAAVMFCEAAGVSLCGKIAIRKNIPMEAGMAGGSTDGAAVLRGLNRALGSPLSLSELCAIGSQLGSDVPFCIVGGTSYADGKGDILHSFPKMPDCTLVIACEGEGVSAPWAYRLLDGIYDGFGETCEHAACGVDRLRSSLENDDIKGVSEALYNIFEEPVLEKRPVAARVRKLMLEGGALAAMMSGSGPAVFGIFACDKCAARASELLRRSGYTPYICKPI